MKRSVASVVPAGVLMLLLLLAGIAPGQPRTEPRNSDSAGIKTLQKERIETLVKIVQILETQYKSGAVDFRRFATAQMELVNAKMEAAEGLEEQIALLEHLLATAKGVLEFTETRFRAGFRVSHLDLCEAQLLCLDIKIRLVRERSKLKPKTK